MNFIKKYKVEIIVGICALLSGIMSFFITLNTHQNDIKKDYASNTTNEKEEIIATNRKAYDDTGIIVEVINEPEEKTINQKSEVSFETKTNVTDNLEKNDIKNINDSVFVDSNEVINEIITEDDSSIDYEVNKNITEEPIQAVSKNAEVKIDYPISGDIIMEFAKDKLIYSETLEEWITHDGIDIAGGVAEPVKAVLAGTIESTKMDPRYGNTIIIKHNDNLKTVYSNLSTLDLVYPGKSVEEGEVISGVGEGFGFETKEGPHVHFEIIEFNEVRQP